MAAQRRGGTACFPSQQSEFWADPGVCKMLRGLEARKVGPSQDQGLFTPHQQFQGAQGGPTCPLREVCLESDTQQVPLDADSKQARALEGPRRGARLLCKANVQRQPSLLMFFGIKLRACALLSTMCQWVNYAQTYCQCESKK